VLKVNAEQLVKVCKSLVSFYAKEEIVAFSGSKENGKLVIKGSSFKFVLVAEFEQDFEFALTINDLLNVAKLTKKEQGGSIEVLIEDSKFVLESGISFGFSVVDANFATCDFDDLGDLVYLDSAKVSAISKCLQRQKDYEWAVFYACGILVTGQFQSSYISFFEPLPDAEPQNSEVIKFSNTQLNNLAKLTNGDLGFSFKNAVVGYETSDLLGLEPSFWLQLPKPEKVKKAKISLGNWLELRRDVKEQEQDVFAITNTKQLEKLISNAKVIDVYDLCSLSVVENKLVIGFYQDNELKNQVEFVDADLQLPEDGFLIHLQTKHLISLLQFANHSISFIYAGDHMPVYSCSDLDIESLTMLSQVV
jgi:hypothetical protein